MKLLTTFSFLLLCSCQVKRSCYCYNNNGQLTSTYEMKARSDNKAKRECEAISAGITGNGTHVHCKVDVEK